MRKLLLFAITIVLLGFKNESLFNKRTVSIVPELEQFNVLTIRELKLDSLSMRKRKKNKPRFKHNRSRIEVHQFENGTEWIQQDTQKELSFPCGCVVKNDTTYISTGFGFFGGVYFWIKMFEDQYYSGYYEYTDDNKPYVLNPTDTSFSRNITVNNVEEKLTIDPVSFLGDSSRLTGSLSFKTGNYYYKLTKDSLVKKNILGKMIFTCELESSKSKF